MKPWRPEEGWDAQLIVYHTPIAYKTGEYQADRDISMVEAGADAMLEALKSQGKFFATKDGFVSIGEEIIVPKHTRGYVVFIPDEE